MTTEDRFFAAVASRRLIRPAVRAIVRGPAGFLVQRPSDAIDGHFAFIGGEYELGDSFADRIRKEFAEETSACVVRSDYRFVVENRFIWRGELIQTLEHYFEVELDRDEVSSKEPHLQQLWLSPDVFADADVRPVIVRDLLLTEDWRNMRHLSVEVSR